jgi:hypothetical protein
VSLDVRVLLAQVADELAPAPAPRDSAAAAERAWRRGRRTRRLIWAGTVVACALTAAVGVATVRIAAGHALGPVSAAASGGSASDPDLVASLRLLHVLAILVAVLVALPLLRRARSADLAGPVPWRSALLAGVALTVVVPSVLSPIYGLIDTTFITGVVWQRAVLVAAGLVGAGVIGLAARCAGRSWPESAARGLTALLLGTVLLEVQTLVGTGGSFGSTELSAPASVWRYVWPEAVAFVGAAMVALPAASAARRAIRTVAGGACTGALVWAFGWSFATGWTTPGDRLTSAYVVGAVASLVPFVLVAGDRLADRLAGTPIATPRVPIRRLPLASAVATAAAATLAGAVLRHVYRLPSPWALAAAAVAYVVLAWWAARHARFAHPLTRSLVGLVVTVVLALALGGRLWFWDQPGPGSSSGTSFVSFNTDMLPGYLLAVVVASAGLVPIAYRRGPQAWIAPAATSLAMVTAGEVHDVLQLVRAGAPPASPLPAIVVGAVAPLAVALAQLVYERRDVRGRAVTGQALVQ